MEIYSRHRKAFKAVFAITAIALCCGWWLYYKRDPAAVLMLINDSFAIVVTLQTY